MYACFVHFKKAVDTVIRDLLWRAVDGIGMGPKMMHCINSMYDTNTARMQTQTRLSDAYRRTIGVKQGCRSAPTCLVSTLMSFKQHYGLLKTATAPSWETQVYYFCSCK